MVYLASPFFNEKELAFVSRAEEILRSRGLTVYSPREHEVRGAEVGTPAWSLATFNEDRKFIDRCDFVVMLYHGDYSDSGTAWECGYAYGIHKPVLVVHVGDGKSSNLMVHEGCHSNLELEDLLTYDFDEMPSKRYEGAMI